MIFLMRFIHSILLKLGWAVVPPVTSNDARNFFERANDDKNRQ